MQYGKPNDKQKEILYNDVLHHGTEYFKVLQGKLKIWTRGGGWWWERGVVLGWRRGEQLANILFSIAFLAAYLEMDDSPVLQEDVLISFRFFPPPLFFPPLFFKSNHFRRNRVYFCGQDFYVMAVQFFYPAFYAIKPRIIPKVQILCSNHKQG